MPHLVLGTSSLGAPGTDSEIAHAAAVAMLRSGLLIDTSNAYAGGHSEQTLGRALADLPADERSAAAARIITKVDCEPGTGVFDADRVRRSCEESMARLGVDRLPLLHLHDPFTITPADAFAPGGAVQGLIRLKEEGVAQTIGIAAGSVPLVQRYVDSGAFDAVLCHNRFTLVDDSATGLFQDAGDRGMTVFNAAVFGGDLLVRGVRPDARYAYRPIDDALARWTTELFAICAAHDVPPAAIALRFSTRSALIHHTVVGVSSPERMAQLQALHETSIPEALWEAIADLGPAPSPIDDAQDGEKA